MDNLFNEQWRKGVIAIRTLSGKECRDACQEALAGWENALAEKLKEKKDQEMVIQILGELQTRAAALILLKTLEDREEALEFAAADALKKYKDEYIIDLLEKMAIKQGRGAAKAIEVLASMDAPGHDVLYNMWFSKEAENSLKSEILLALASINDPRVERLGFLAMVNSSEDLQRSGIKAATDMEIKPLWPSVAALLESDNIGIKAKACKALGDLGVKDALKILTDMDPDPDPWVEEERMDAIEVLKSIR